MLMRIPSLRLRFSLAVIPLIAILFLAIYAGFNYYIKNIIADLSERFAEQQVSFDRGRTLQPLLQEIALARKLARSPAITDWAADEDDPGKRARGLAELESARQIFKDGSYFFAVDRSGHYYFNDAKDTYAGRQLRYSLSPDKPDDGWYYATLKNPQECQLNVNNDTELQVTKIWINCLVRKDGETVGVIGTGVELSSFISSVLKSKRAGVLNMFVDGDGAIQAHPDVELIDFRTLTKPTEAKKTVYKLLTDAPSREKLSALLSKLKSDPERVEAVELTIGGEDKLVGIAYLKEIDWYNLTVITPRVWALGQGFVPLAVLMFIGIVLTLLVGAYLLHRLVLSRVSRLDNAVRKIQENDFSIDLNDPVPDEIGRLSEGLNEMAAAVLRQKTTLEKEVAARTKDLTAARDEAEAANKAKSEFLAAMSHDLRTPLNAIVGFSEMMMYKTHGNLGHERYDSYAQDIHASGSLLISLINNVLDLSKIEAGKYEFVETELSVNGVLETCLKQLNLQAQEAKVTVDLKLDGNDLTLIADERALIQIINNLLSNAIKFTPEGGRVTVSSERDAENGTIVFVRDTGVGMSATDLTKALAPFEQADSKLPRKRQGSGLGLHITQNLMSLFGGTMDIQSEVGAGTTVRLHFPPERTPAAEAASG